MPPVAPTPLVDPRVTDRLARLPGWSSRGDESSYTVGDFELQWTVASLADGTLEVTARERGSVTNGFTTSSSDAVGIHLLLVGSAAGADRLVPRTPPGELPSGVAVTRVSAELARADWTGGWMTFLPARFRRLVPTLALVEAGLSAVIDSVDAPDGAPVLVPANRYAALFSGPGRDVVDFDGWVASRES